MAAKKKTFDVHKEVRAIARERVGRVPASKPIPPKPRRKPKHKKQAEDED